MILLLSVATVVANPVHPTSFALMSRRSRAREIVLQLLYQDDLNPDQSEIIRQRFVESRLHRDRGLIKFVHEILEGIEQNLEAVDAELEKTAQNWKLSRMAVTDRNVLRLGAYEILFSNTPDRVAINEAIELAKRYGTNQSAQFVNGILDRLMNRRRHESPGTEESSAEQKQNPA